MWAKKLAAMFTAAVIFFSAASPAFANENGYDWEKGVLRVVGLAGFQKEQYPEWFWRNHAQQGARLDALRNFVESVCLIEVISDEKSNEITTYLDDNTTTKIVASGAHLVNSKFFEDGTCEVTMEIPIFGKNSAAEAIFSLAKEKPKENFPNPTTKVNIGKENYTGLILDCRGLKITRSLNPVVKVDEKFLVYDQKYLNYNKIFDKVVNYGMAEYVTDINRQTRAGKKPLIIKATEKNKNTFDIIISKDDANKILTANKKFHFLDNCAVVIVY